MNKFLILDGYPIEDRHKFENIGMTLAGNLYFKMLSRFVANPNVEIIYTSDSSEFLTSQYLEKFSAVLWPGCSLTVYHDDWRVKKMLDIARKAFELGIPQFGSCWAAQVAVHVVGGKVEAHPGGREIGISRRIRKNEAGHDHPMYRGKPDVFEAFSSHDDYIAKIPPEFCPALTSNDWCGVQSVMIRYLKGEFWATQYHPEYNFREMGKLLFARKEKLLKQKYFETEAEIKQLHDDFLQIEQSPTKHLLWKYGIGDGLSNLNLRDIEFKNWLQHFFPNLLK